MNLIKAAGATPDPGTTSGRYDINGNRYAEGSFPTPAGAVPTGGGTSGPEKISVRTYTNNADRDAADASLRTTSDSQTAIRVDLAWVTVDAVDLYSTGAYLYYVSPTVIAARVHGVVVPVAP